MRILVVDDSEDARELTEAALMSAGYDDVVTADSAWDAIRLLDLGGAGGDAVPIDIVLLDIVMPQMDGIEACARIRNDERYADIPIIMVTSLDDMDSLANAFVAGATDYVTKPVNRIELVARVRAALKLKAELERRQARERELLAFVSNWGDRRATLWIDEATGLFVGEVVEAYLTAAAACAARETVSVLVLALDRFDNFRSVHGEDAGKRVLARVAQALRSVTGTVGIVAGAYRNGLIVLVAPGVDATAANQLGETLRRVVARLRLKNSEAMLSDDITASVATATGPGQRDVERIQLLTRAIASVQKAATDGGDCVLAV